MVHARLPGLRARFEVVGDAPAIVERNDGVEGLLGWENMEDAKRKLRAHGPALVHDKHHFIARAPAPTHVAQVDDAPLKARQQSNTEIIGENDVNPADAAPTLVVQTGRPTSAATTSTATTVTNTPTPTPTKAPESSGGDDGIAMKAGIALGVLGALFIIFLIVYLILRSRRKAQENRREDEKLSADEMSDRRASTKTSGTAPRLSLRPVTQFLPKFSDDGKQIYPDRRASKDAAAQPTAPDGTTKALPAAPGSTGSKNPFRDSAERPTTPRSGVAAEYDAAPVSPVSESSEVGSFVSRGPPSPPGSPGLGTSSLVRSTSVRKNAPKALDLTLPPPKKLATIPPSPTGTEYSFHSMAAGAEPGPSQSAAAIAEAGGPAATTVHRVQLDFKPTLDDELGLKAGQLVRLLHEYDDGWALCIRLDRSQQGVVPRTCLSTRPVKPRPNPAGMRGPPSGPRPDTYSRPKSPNPPSSAPGTAY